jgi:hypothetical protein
MEEGRFGERQMPAWHQRWAGAIRRVHFMLKKMMLLASLALAVVAFAAPASASAQGTLFDGTTPIPTGNHITLETTGVISFDVPELASSFGCNSHPKVTLVSGHPSTGTVEAFNITTSECAGTGLLEGCVLANDTTNKPAVDVSATVLTITNIEINNVFAEGCIVPGSKLTFPAVVATPDNTKSISSVKVSGNGVDDVTGLLIEATGTLNIAGGAAGTYGIG